MKTSLKITGVILGVAFLTGCENPQVRKQLEQKVVELNDAMTTKDQEIQKLKDGAK